MCAKSTSAVGRSSGPGTLGATLRAAEPDHPCTNEALTILAKLGNYVCVDSTADFVEHTKAVTDRGLRKDSAKLAIKDDRQQLRPSQYIFVGNVSAKIAALQEELESENELYEQARARSAELDRERTAKEQRRDAYRRVCEQFAAWNEIDLDTADDRVDALTEQYELLMEENPDTEALQRKAEDIWEQVRSAISQAALVRDKIATHDKRRTQLLDLVDRLKIEPVSAHAEATLDRFREESAAVLDVLGPDVTLQCEVYDDGGVRFAEAHGLEARHPRGTAAARTAGRHAALRAERAISERLTFTSFVGLPRRRPRAALGRAGRSDGRRRPARRPHPPRQA